VPATATNSTRLVSNWEPTSSFWATDVRAVTEVPVYTARTVSKALPAVSIVTAPEAGVLLEVCVLEGSTCSEGAVVARLQV